MRYVLSAIFCICAMFYSLAYWDHVSEQFRYSWWSLPTFITGFIVIMVTWFFVWVFVRD